MALINQSGMYQGTPVLNPLPYVQMAMQARARKAAKDEAIDRYYQKLPDTINEKGIRDAEIPIINEMKNRLFEKGMKNREALRNPKLDNGASRYEMDKDMREIAGVARLSQNAGKVDLEAGKLRLTKDGRWIVDDDEFIADSEAHNLPVTDPNHKTLDLNKILQNKPFDEAALVREIKGMFPASDGTPIIRSHPTDKNLEIVESNPQFNDAAKQGIFALAADKLHGNKAFRKKIEDDVSKNPELLTPLNEISKKVFGHYIREDFADEDIAAAYLYSKLPTTTVKQKVIPSIDAKNAEWDRRNKLTFEQSKEITRLNNANRQKGLPSQDTGYLPDEVAAENGVTIEIPEKKSWTGSVTPARTVRFIPVKSIDPERLDIITGRNPSKKQHGVEPITMKMPDGSTQVGYEQDQKTGDWIGKDNQVISREAAKDRYINSMSGTAFKTKVNTKASENTKKEAPKTKTPPAKKGALDDL